MPKHSPPYSTGQRSFYDWHDSGLLQTICFHLVMETQQREARKASPTAGVIDNQSVKTTESGRMCGFDAGNKVKGRKRHSVVDTIALLTGLGVHAADIQDRDGAPAVLTSIRRPAHGGGTSSPRAALKRPKLRGSLERIGTWTIKIVKRSDISDGFDVLPRRWVVERTCAWLGRCQKLAKGCDKSIASAKAWINLAHIRLTTRRLERYC